jgi:cytochrome P450
MNAGLRIETVVEVCALAGMVWPLWRLCAARPVWLAYPRLAGAVTIGLLGYVLVLLELAFRAPVILRGLAALGGVLWIALAWRARPAHGSAQNWPPGSLAISPADAVLDHLFFLKLAARYGPIFKTMYLLQPMVCVLGLQRGRDLLERYDHALISPALPFSQSIERGFIRYMKRADHDRYRPVIQSALAQDILRGNEEFITQHVRQTLTQMAANRGSAPTSIRPEPHVRNMLMAISLKLFFGMEPGPESARLVSKYDQLHHGAMATRSIFGSAADIRGMAAISHQKLAQILEEIMAIIRNPSSASGSNGQAAGPGCFWRAVLRDNPEVARDPTVLANLVFIVQTSVSDLTGLFMWILKMLGDNPQWVVRMQEESLCKSEPSGPFQNELPTRVVLETLRLEQSEYVVRKTVQEIRLNGYVIPKGWLMRICVRESHRSADIFEHPDRFDPDRFLAREFSGAEYAPFGIFRATCLGASLTMTLGRIFISVLARDFNWKVVRDGPREFRAFHWRPSSKFRIDLASRRPSAPDRVAESNLSAPD